MHGTGQYFVGSGTSATPATIVARERIQAVDLLRGLVIILMILDHVRDYFHAEAFLFSAVDPDRSYPALFAVRWVTHLCAPVFVALAGVSAYLQLKVGKPVSYVRRHLWTRGLWLIVLELTVVGFGFNFGIPVPFLQVIWAIGWSMLAMAVVVGLPVRAVLAIGAAIVLGHNLLDPISPTQIGAWGLGWQFLHEGGPIIVGGGQPIGLIAYPILPWIGVMFLGFGAGRAFMLKQVCRQRLFAWGGAAMLVAFVTLRATNGIGDPQPWSARDETARTVMAFMDVEKYPPSLLYVLATLGIALMITPLLERLPHFGRELLLTYGRVPLFAYLTHIYVVHGLMLATAIALGNPSIAVGFVTNAFTNPQALEGWGFGLPVTFAAWALSLAILYPLCRWFGDLKRRRRDPWLYYL